MQPAAAADYAVILKTLSNPYWVAMRDGIQKEAKAKGVEVDVFAANSEDDIQGQQRLLEDAVNKTTKAIGVAPLTAVSDPAYRRGQQERDLRRQSRRENRS